MYLANDKEPGYFNLQRLKLYNSVFTSGKFQPLEEIQIAMSKFPSFQPDFATNPDSMMRNWNQMVPQLKPLRAKAQSAFLLWGGKKL